MMKLSLLLRTCFLSYKNILYLKRANFSWKFKDLKMQQNPMGHYQLGQKNTVYLEMIYLGVQCMYFCAKPLQNQCILGLVRHTKQTMYLESYLDLNALKVIVKIKFDVNYVKLDLIRTFNLNNTLHQLWEMKPLQLKK